MTQTRRERKYAATKKEIKETAAHLMVKRGTAGLSMRAIAREMKMTAPALYRYFDSLDDLITALIVDAFTGLAEALEEARDRVVKRPVAEQLLTVALAYRQWALAHSVKFQLIYGSPIPGYEAPREITVPAATRGFVLFVKLIVAALESGELAPSQAYQVVPSELAPHLAEVVAQEARTISPEALYLAVSGWPKMHGIIMLELFNHLQPVVGDCEVFYRLQMIETFRTMGLKMIEMSENVDEQQR